MRRNILLILIFTLVSLAAQQAHAAEFKVKKIKGNQALVDVEKGTLEEGKSYSTGARDAFDEFAESPSHSKRKNSLELDFSLASVKAAVGSSAGSTTTTMLFAGRLGFNMKRFEVGPFLGLSNTSASGASVTGINIGPYADWNFVLNEPQNSTIPGLRVSLGYFSLSGSGSSLTGPGITGDFFVKMFAFENTAIVITAGYTYESLSSSGTGSVKTTVSGLVSSAGYTVYF